MNLFKKENKVDIEEQELHSVVRDGIISFANRNNPFDVMAGDVNNLLESMT